MPNLEEPIGTGGGGGISGLEGPSFPDKPGKCDEALIRDNALLRAANKIYNDTFEFTKCKTHSSFIAAIVASPIALLVGGAGAIVGLALGTVTKIASGVGTGVLELLGEARKEAAPDLNKLVIATLNEMFGTEFTDEDLPTAGDFRSAKERARRIGDKVISLLEGEFAPAGRIDEQQGQDAARTFTGFTVNFSVVSAFIAILGELVTAGQLESFRELGVELAQNLGLGRLSRRGLSELVSTTVATPYEWFLMEKYRPTLLGPGQAVKAFLRGQVAPEDLFEELSRQGYSTERINSLIADAQTTLSVDDLDVLVRYGKWTTAQAVDHLRGTGLPLELAEAKFAAVDLKRVDAHVREHVSLLRTQRENGVLDPIQFATSLQELPISEDEIHTIRAVTEAKLELPRKFLTLGQMRDAFIEGVVDLEELNDFLVREGYSRDDQTILRISILLRLAEQTKAEQEREERRKRLEAKRKALSPKPPPSP